MEKISKEKIRESSRNKRKKSPLLTLALIHNDLNDLIFLHDLVSTNSPRNLDTKTVSPELGQFSGRRLYIVRLVLSHLHEMLIFFKKNQQEIDSDVELQNIINSLDKEERALWTRIQKFSIGKDLTKTGSNLFNLFSLARDQLTFHYYHSSKYIFEGFELGFVKDVPSFNNENALATNSGDVDKDRSYYIDLAIQRHLELSSNLGVNLFQFENNELVNIVAGFNKVIGKIIAIYHSKIMI